MSKQATIDDCKIINLRKMQDPRGNLTPIEGNVDVPFEIKRIFYLYDVPWLDRADCVFKVNGDSMEPEYHSGDYVLIERIPDAPELKHGEIGAFAIGNELYIKEFQEDGLHSLNTKYPVMTFDDDTKVYLIGRVLSVVDQKDIATDEDVRLYQTVKE